MQHQDVNFHLEYSEDTGKLNEEYLTGINHDGVDVVVEKSQLVDYMGWKIVRKTDDELKFLS